VKYLAHAGKLEKSRRSQIALDETTLETVPTFHPHGFTPFFHFVNRRSAIFRAECRQGPAGRIEHAHAALAVHDNNCILQAAIARSGDVQDVLGLL